MPAPALTKPLSQFRRHRFAGGIGALFAAAALAVGLLAVPSLPASAAAAPITQCNDDTASNVGGQGIACTVTIENHVLITGDGEIEASAPATVTVTRCTGAAGPVGAGAGTCATTTTTSAEPITIIQQCNGSANGGGGVLNCTVTVANTVSSASPATLASATVYQCVGSEITGPGAPAVCSPANTAGVTSVTAATVGQCNGSGNGGTSVGFVCTVTGDSTMTSAFAVNVDQCNGSANGGGALVNCTATVTNTLLVQAATPTPTPTPTVAPTVAPTVTPTPSASPTAAATPASSPTVPPSSGPGTGPEPAETGSAGLDEQAGTSWFVALLMGATAVGLLGAGRFVSARRDQ